MCTIVSIDSDMGWFYLSCNVCAKKLLVVPNDDVDDEDDEDDLGFKYFCVKCKVHEPKVVLR